jgi:hypothetical protein
MPGKKIPIKAKPTQPQPNANSIILFMLSLMIKNYIIYFFIIKIAHCVTGSFFLLVLYP